MKRSIFALFMLVVFCTSCHDTEDVILDGDPLIYLLTDETTLECVSGDRIDVVIPQQQHSVQLKFVTEVKTGLSIIDNADNTSVEFAAGYSFEDKVVYDYTPYTAKGKKKPRYMVIVNVNFDKNAAPDAHAEFKLNYFLIWDPVIKVTRGETYSMTITERTDIYPTDNAPQQE